MKFIYKALLNFTVRIYFFFKSFLLLLQFLLLLLMLYCCYYYHYYCLYYFKYYYNSFDCDYHEIRCIAYELLLYTQAASIGGDDDSTLSFDTTLSSVPLHTRL